MKAEVEGGEGDASEGGAKGVPSRGRRLWGSGRASERGDGEDNKSRSVSPGRLLGGLRGRGGRERDGSRSVSPRRLVRGERRRGKAKRGNSYS